MNRVIELSVVGGLAVVAYLGTYWLYFEADEAVTDPADADGVALYTAATDELQKVTWQTERRTLVLEPLSDDRGEYLQVTVTTRTEQAPPPPEPDAADADDTDVDDTDAEVDDTDTPATSETPPEPEVVVETETFVGSERAWDLWASFAPFRADRTVDASSLDAETLGFDEPYGTLTVDRAGGTETIVVGGTTYGDRSYYLRSGEQVYLIGKRDLSTLDGTPASLQERRLHPIERADVASVQLAHDGETRTFVQRDVNDKTGAYFADEATPDLRDDAASTLIPTILRLAASDTVDDAEAPAEPEQVLSVTVSDGSEDWSLTLLASDDEAPVYYARSPYQRGLVTLVASQVEEVLADLEPVMDRSDDGPADEPNADDEAPAPGDEADGE